MIKQGRISSYFTFQPCDFITGRLEGVFENSLNICLGEELVHLGSLKQPLCCFGMAVDQEELRHILSVCRNKEIVVLKKNRLTIYGSDIIELDLETMERADLQLPPEGNCSGEGIVKLFAAMPDLLELGIRQDQEFIEHVRLLCREKPEQQALEWFMGRGRGLTPSGDDILTGFGISQWLLGRSKDFLESLGRCDLARTTNVSAAYLKLLQKGFANENFIELLKVIPGETSEQLGGRIREIRKLGHTSGDDTLFGLKAGLRAFSHS